MKYVKILFVIFVAMTVALSIGCKKTAPKPDKQKASTDKGAADKAAADKAAADKAAAGNTGTASGTGNAGTGSAGAVNPASAHAGKELNGQPAAKAATSDISVAAGEYKMVSPCGRENSTVKVTDKDGKKLSEITSSKNAMLQGLKGEIKKDDNGTFIEAICPMGTVKIYLIFKENTITAAKYYEDVNNKDLKYVLTNLKSATGDNQFLAGENCSKEDENVLLTIQKDDKGSFVELKNTEGKTDKYYVKMDDAKHTIEVAKADTPAKEQPSDKEASVDIIDEGIPLF